MEAKPDIHKAGGVLIQNRKFLFTRSRGKNIFYAPGGKLDGDETAPQALIRELQEELQISVKEKDLTLLGTFHAISAGTTDKSIRMDVFIVEKWNGVITPASEIEEIKWIDSHVPQGIELGSIFGHDVLPKLKKMDYID
jgi:8-oxo-dGTP pyrophosphatase MutT (NUDIX family)